MNLFKAASTVSLLTLASRITGLVREQLIAAAFGANDAERQRRRFGLDGGGLVRRARLGGCCGTRRRLVRFDLLDLRSQRLKVAGSGVACQGLLDLGNARLQGLAGVLQACGCCGRGPLLQVLSGLGQPGHLRF